MKKILTCSIILIMVSILMSTSVLAKELVDVVDTEYEESIMNLIQLGIVGSFPDGKFGVDEKVNKAQAATMLVRALNLEPVAKKYKDKNFYDDVNKEYHFSGYVNVQHELGIMDIEGGKIFNPYKNVTAAETITYMVRILGYGNITDREGTWPTAYRLKAIELGIADGMSFRNDEEITRKDFCLLLWNTFNTKMWGKINSTTYGQIDTLLKVKFPEAKLYQKEYRVEFIDDGNGSIKSNKSKFVENENINLTIVPNKGYKLEKLTVTKIKSNYVRDYTSEIKDGKLQFKCPNEHLKIEVKFKEVVKKKINLNLIGTLSKEYNGMEQEIVLEGFNPEIMTIKENKAINVGNYKAIITIKDPEKYQLCYKDICDSIIEIDWKITEAKIIIPKVSKIEYDYNNSDIKLDMLDLDNKNVKVEGNIQKEIGEYYAIVSLKDKINFSWEDGTKEDITYKWKIINISKNENNIEKPEENNIEKETEVYKIKIFTNNGGKVRINNFKVEKGENQTFRIIPDEGYEIIDVLINDTSVGIVNKYTLENIKKDYDVYVKFAKKEIEILENKFEDVKDEDWFYDSVNFVNKNGLFKGVSEKEFAPNLTMNRAMLVTVLYRLSGEKEINFKNKFKDVEVGSYYEKAINWATKNKIVSGINENEFAPQNKITREQLAVMLYRFAKLNGENIKDEIELKEYIDVNQINEYANAAMRWAVNEGYINGRSMNMLVPQGTATRAEVATILMRFNKKIE